MRLTHLAVVGGLSLAVTACVPEGGEAPVTTIENPATSVAPTTAAPTTAAPTTAAPTTAPPTTAAPLPTITATGTATKTLGCFAGIVTGNDRFFTTLGADGYWNFGFAGCSAGATETVALIGSNNFKAPGGYQCKLAAGGDETDYFTNKVGTGLGGHIFLESSSAWPDSTTWTITCVPVA